MTIALIITGGLLGLVAFFSALGKLAKKPALLEQLGGLGVPASMIPVLGLLEIAGAIGLIVGIWVPALGIAAAIGLALYFLGAVLAHARHHDTIKELAPALVLFLLAVATVVLELQR
jgi:uncharacterized membrane protein